MSWPPSEGTDGRAHWGVWRGGILGDLHTVCGHSSLEPRCQGSTSEISVNLTRVILAPLPRLSVHPLALRKEATSLISLMMISHLCGNHPPLFILFFRRSR